jgi:hypothetical protein
MPRKVWLRLSVQGDYKSVTEAMGCKKKIDGLCDLARSVLATDPAWMPDLFAALYDVLDCDGLWRSAQHKFLNSSRNPLLLDAEEAQFRAAHLSGTYIRPGFDDPCECSIFRSYALQRVDELQAWAKSSVAGLPPLELVIRIAWIARAIDAVFVGLTIRSAISVAAPLQKYWDQLLVSHTLLKAASGKLIPRVTAPSYGNSLAQFFSALTRPDSDFDKFADYKVSAGSAPMAGAHPRIGFIPVVHQKNEVVWSRKGGNFCVRLVPSKENVIGQRVIRALDWLSDNGAEIVVMPELISTELVRDRISDWLLTKGSRKPFLILEGSEAVVESGSPTGFSNRAFVKGSNGILLWTQDKRNQFTLRQRNIRDYSLTKQLGANALDEIGSSAGGLISVRDILGAGRFAVLVCEDYSRDAPGRRAVMRAGVETCLVVIMNGRHRPTGWRQRVAVELAQEPGSRSAIVNSHALLSRMRGGARKIADVAYYCLPDQTPTTWSVYRDGSRKVIALLAKPAI